MRGLCVPRLGRAVWRVSSDLHAEVPLHSSAGFCYRATGDLPDELANERSTAAASGRQTDRTGAARHGHQPVKVSCVESRPSVVLL